MQKIYPASLASNVTNAKMRMAAIEATSQTKLTKAAILIHDECGYIAQVQNNTVLCIDQTIIAVPHAWKMNQKRQKLSWVGGTENNVALVRRKMVPKYRFQRNKILARVLGFFQTNSISRSKVIR